MKSSKIKNGKLKSLPSQDPHSVRADKERNLEAAIGKEARGFRRSKKITVKELSHQMGLSMGMLSKIENGVTSPSLTTLQLLASALGVPLTVLFRRYEEDRKPSIQRQEKGSKSFAKARGLVTSIGYLVILAPIPVVFLQNPT